jgi:DNA repair exonuclease SbcCD ATPase subunit
VIPIQIAIEGFLSYRQRQVIDLRDMQLCMLSGPNGSGKSAVFDAMTIALFNLHRAGRSGREDLINKKCDTATIEFDFELRGARWQARRTLSRRGNPTQYIRRWSEAANNWEMVPDTNSARGYANWIETHVGVSAETFTSSMLLRQGQADRLLMSAPRERAELLATVVGLEQYQALHDRVTIHCRTRRQQLRDLEVQLAAMPQVTDQQIADGESALQATRTALTTAESKVERLQPLLDQSKRWADLERQIKSAETEQQQLAALLSRAASVAQEAARLRDIQGVLPKLRRLVATSAKRERALAQVKTLTARRGEQAAAQQALAGELEANQKAHTLAVAESQARLDRERVLAPRLAELKVVLAQADLVQQQTDQLSERRAELAKLPASPDRDLQQARGEQQRLTELSEAFALLNQLANQRSVIHEAQQPLSEQREIIEASQRELEANAAERETVQRDMTAAEAAQRDAQQQDADAQAELRQARAALQTLEKASGQAECPTCGNELTAEHLAQEQARRRAAKRAATDARAAAAKILQASEDESKRLRQRRAALDEKRTQLESRFQEATREARKFGDEIDKAVQQCRSIYRELAPAYRDRVGDISDAAAKMTSTWLAVSWPAAPDLAAIKTDLDALPRLRQQITGLEAVCGDWQRLNAQVEALEKSLGDRTALDVAPLRHEQAMLAAEQTALQQAIDEDKQRAAQRAIALEDLKVKSDALAKELSGLDTTIALETQHSESLEREIANCQAELTGDWRTLAIDPPLIDALDREQQQLESAGVEQAERQLQAARTQAQVVEAKLELLRQQSNEIAPEARLSPAEAQQQLEAARTQRLQSQNSHQQSQQALVSLRQAKDARAEKEEQRRTLAREHGHYDQLSELLGRNGLQRYLIREAERAIVKYANDILTPISGGDLLLRLRANSEQGQADGDDHALDLEAYHTRISNAEAIAVSFLSGSQQFRVAVALALAIGQYAGGGNRLGDCVIIDEGFGSLDTQGQDVMIEELRRLRGIMKRIILVSHQESFANAFPTGFRFQLNEDGETRVSRISA